MKPRRAEVGQVAGQIPVLLRTHARTMALSLRLLPRPLREPLGLAYLLARASDTIADSGTASREQRIACLEEIAAALGGESIRTWQLANQPQGLSAAEQDLLAAFPGLFGLLAQSPDQDELTELCREILEGQLFDLRRFMPGSGPLERSELEYYCGLVAGSVGRCWTRLIAKHAPRTFLLPPEEILPFGVSYGRGLQLVNILRDRGADRAVGRFYTAEAEIPALLMLARGWLSEGERYLREVRPGRILMASALPLDLARATLPLIASAPSVVRAKLPRRRVRATLARNLRCLWLPRRADPA